MSDLANDAAREQGPAIGFAVSFEIMVTTVLQKRDSSGNDSRLKPSTRFASDQYLGAWVVYPDRSCRCRSRPIEGRCSAEWFEVGIWGGGSSERHFYLFAGSNLC